MKKQTDIDLSEFIGLQLKEVNSHLFLFDKGKLEIDCPWRVRDKLIYLCPNVLDFSYNEKKAKEIVTKNLIGRKIKSIKIFNLPCDVEIIFDNGAILEIFPIHPLYESWNLKKMNGKHLIGIGGGDIQAFKM
ncbi:MAG TPA: hypothetical protein VE978_03540 [Chitinophagales bacterium]|nr:hypothetical protein [Chitinophagales bacterium]